MHDDERARRISDGVLKSLSIAISGAFVLGGALALIEEFVMARPVDGGRGIVEELIANASCSLILDPDTGPGIIGIAARSVAYGGTGLLGEPSPGAIRRARNTLYALCGAVPDDDDEALNPPEFQGGQCETMYRVDGDYRVRYVQAASGVEVTTNPLQVNGDFIQVGGPVSGFRAELTQNSIQIYLDGNPGALLAGIGVIASEAEVVQPNITLTRLDGQPDDCGNPPSSPVPLPPNFSPEVPVNVPIQPPGGGPPVDTPFDVNFDPSGPQTGPNGEPFWDGELCDGTLVCIPFSLDLSPTFSPTIGLPGPFGNRALDPCCYPPSDVGEEESGNLNPDDNNLPIRGVRVALFVPPDFKGATNITNGASPVQFYVPRLGVLRMWYRDDAGNLYAGEDVDVKSTAFQYVVPSGSQAVGADFQPYPGLGYNLTYLV